MTVPRPCPLCQRERSSTKNDLIRAYISKMKALHAEWTAKASKSEVEQSIPAPRKTQVVKLEPGVEESQQQSIPRTSSPARISTPRAVWVDRSGNEQGGEEKWYNCPVKECKCVYRKFGAALINHALEKHGILIRDSDRANLTKPNGKYGRRRKKRARCLVKEDFTSPPLKRAPLTTPVNGTNMQYQTTSQPSADSEGCFRTVQVIPSPTTKDENCPLGSKKTWNCPSPNCKSVYRKYGQALIRHAFEKHGIVIKSPDSDRHYSCPAPGCRSVYRKYGAALLHHALEKHGIVLKIPHRRRRRRKRKDYNLRGSYSSSEDFHEVSKPTMTEKDLAEKIMAQVRHSASDSQQLHAKGISSKPLPCTNCGLLFTDRSEMIEHWQAVHNKSKEEPQYQCTTSNCRETFKSELALRRHSRLHFPGTREAVVPDDERKKFQTQVESQRDKQDPGALEMENEEEVTKSTSGSESQSETESDSCPEQSSEESIQGAREFLRTKPKRSPVPVDVVLKKSVYPDSVMNPLVDTTASKLMNPASWFEQQHAHGLEHTSTEHN